MSTKTVTLGIVAAIAALLVSSTVWYVGNANATESSDDMSDKKSTDSDHMKTSVVRDSAAFLLELRRLPAKDYIHLYDTTPYMIMNGHVAAKIPCGDNSEPKVQILVGQAPDLKPAELELISELSTPGQLCLYHADLMSEHGEDVPAGSPITDIALYNPTDSPIRFPLTTSVVIGVNEIMPGAEEHSHGEDHMEDDE
jgi:hypothetical protein